MSLLLVNMCGFICDKFVRTKHGSSPNIVWMIEKMKFVVGFKAFHCKLQDHDQIKCEGLTGDLGFILYSTWHEWHVFL